MVTNSDYKHNGAWSTDLILTVISMCASGTLVIVSMKIQGTTYDFKHSMSQTFLMFVGEYLNLIFFVAPLICSPASRNTHFQDLISTAIATNQNLHGTKMWAALPSLLDSLSSNLQIASLLLLPASIAQMLHGGQIISTCIFAKIINRSHIHRHHMAGVVVSTLGFAFVGLSGYLDAQSDVSGKYNPGGFLMGVGFIFVNLTLVGVQVNLDERIITKNAITPQRMVGLEGLFGIIWMIGSISILSYIRCPDDQLCDRKSYTEDVTAALTQIFNSSGLTFWCLMTVISMAAYNFTAMRATQLVSAIFRIFWSTMVTVLVWIVCLLVGYERFNALPFTIQFIGFSLLVLGNVTYNGFIKLACFDLDSTKMDK